MRAIHVKVVAATTTKPTRYKAMGYDLCAVTNMDHNLRPEANAALAAQVLLDNYNSTTNRPLTIAGTGTLPDNTIAVLVTSK